MGGERESVPDNIARFNRHLHLTPRLWRGLFQIFIDQPRTDCPAKALFLTGFSQFLCQIEGTGYKIIKISLDNLRRIIGKTNVEMCLKYDMNRVHYFSRVK